MTVSAVPLDFIAVGRASVDLYGQQIGGRLEDMGSFAKYLGGSPANTATGGARLGLATALLTRVGDDHMGRFIREQLGRDGVDISAVIADPDRLTALAILGIRDRETFPLLFYREDCADMALSAADVDPAWIASARALVVNGTHLSRPGVFAACDKAIRAARGGGRRIVFDIDYRPVLWGLERRDRGENRFVADPAVTARLQSIASDCHLIVGTEEEFRILGGMDDLHEALRCVRRLSDALLVCKRGADGCVLFPNAIPPCVEDGLVVPGFAIEVFNVLGAGDAFMAGFLRGWLRDEPLDRCARFGNACGALVVSRHGCAPAMPTWPELERFLSMTDHPVRLRDDAVLDHVHWAGTRSGRYDPLMVLAVDHRSQFEELIEQTGGDAARIPRFKTLALRAVDAAAQGDTAFGVLLDGRYGFDALAAAGDTPYWIGRPIERPKSRPLEFESSADVAAELIEWPLNHVVKCLVIYHPDDEAGLRDRQERQLLRLFDACRKTRHELLLEVISPDGMPIAPTTIGRAIRRLYAIGIRPDWWKLEPASDPDAWADIAAAVTQNDPLCRGVLVLGLSAPEAELLASFAAAAPFPVVKGFAVGRTIFADVARDWFAGRINDSAAIAEMARRFAVLVDAWRAARNTTEEAM